jgi:beta-mannanase
LPPTPVPLPSPIAWGAYDPQGLLDNTSILSVQHEFVNWFEPEGVSKALEKARELGRFPLISLEPWPQDSPQTLLEDITLGKYDQLIQRNARVIKSVSPQRVLVRWGHEMELTGLYPWAQGNPQLYVAAYQHIVDIFRKEEVNNVLWVWSPAGNQGAEEFWPGKEYVDFIGITILADEKWDHQAGFSSLRSFETLLSEKYRLSQYSKPIIIAELGVSVCPQRQTWLKEAKSSLSRFPQLFAVIYFNAPNTHVVDGYQPNWTVTEEELLLLSQN